MGLRVAVCLACIPMLAEALNLLPHQYAYWQFLLCYASLVCMLLFCGEIRWSTACYCSIWALMTQQLTAELMQFVRELGGMLHLGSQCGFLVSGIIFAGSYCVLGLTISRFMPERGQYHVGPRQLGSAWGMLILFEILFYTLFIKHGDPPEPSSWGAAIFSQFYCATVIYLQNELFKKSSLRKELDTLKLLQHKQKVQYDLAKENIALINRKCHDLKHQMQYHLLGDILRYYNLKGKVKAVSMSSQRSVQPVEFYVETPSLPAVKVTDQKTGEVLPVQLSSHPRGVLVSFLAEFEPMEEKQFSYEELPAPDQKLFTRTAWVGAERVRDIINDYDAESYKLPHMLENEWFRISYAVGEGITSFYNKKSGTEMMKGGLESFFTPIYERTEIRRGVGSERSVLGRNIRGLHAEQYQGDLKDIKLLDHGPVFDRIELLFELEGTYHSSVILKMYKRLPRLEFTYRIAKTLSEDIESVYLPLSLNLPGSSVYIHNGGAAMRPGIDQLPGSNMEYYIADEGVLYQGEKESVLINTLDTALLYMGQMEHHPIVLCDNKEENNHRPVYSWIMNNTWETNFKMDLSGFGEFSYSLELQEGAALEENLEKLEENDLGCAAFITE